MASKEIKLEITYMVLVDGKPSPAVATYRCTSYEIRPDESNTFILSMFVFDPVGAFIEAEHVAQVVHVIAVAVEKQDMKNKTIN